VTLSAGSRKAGATFGLLAGTAAQGASLENLQISGTLILGKNMFLGQDLSIGAISSRGDLGLDASRVAVESEEGGPAFTRNEDGTLTLAP
jgi:hypothetical protein